MHTMTLKEKSALALWWTLALSITVFLFLGAVNTLTVILE